MTLFVFKITFILIFSSVIITIVLFYGDWIMNIFICDDDNLVCEQIKTLCESYYIEHTYFTLVKTFWLQISNPILYI